MPKSYGSLVDENVFRIKDVPSEDDLERIKGKVHSRPDGEETLYKGYTESELIEYAAEMTEHSRKNFEDFGDIDMYGRGLQIILTAGAGATASFAGGDWQTVYLSSLAVGGASEAVLRKSEQTRSNPYDEDIEEAIEYCLEGDEPEVFK